ncbi:hypothetical protein RHSIM_Rhsim11G0045500 [Rhododendron simsii]|uniref:DDE Tnp4 domain-containing protein n=1 Tax=Rhododendron simsii TaxID=118357 RepID=A0A834LB14_RHOSS|nr:hypothetical protein RHSIM_Rhsim11G0045500 [Rhododendron simsii]
MANYENPDDYDHDIYDEENWDNDDPYGGDPYDGDPYDTGEGSSHPRPRRAHARMRRVAIGICKLHHDTYMCKEPCRTSALTSQAWVTELEEGNPAYAGYPNTTGYLAPYKGSRYHPPEWRDGGAPRTNFEKFNKIHSSLRCTIERTYRVSKARWPLICDMLVGFTMTTQVALVSATMAIHNFIRRNNFPDIPFGFYDRRPNFLPSDRGVETTAPNDNHGSRVQHDDRNMDIVRASMRDFIMENSIR